MKNKEKVYFFSGIYNNYYGGLLIIKIKVTFNLQFEYNIAKKRLQFQEYIDFTTTL